jgi:peroxiredoxin
MYGWSNLRRTTTCVVVLAVLAGLTTWGEIPANGSAGASLPQFVLADPDGRKHASSELLKGGLVLVVTAPTYHTEKAQRAWGDLLPAAQPKGKVRLVFLEDMTASSFKGTAKKQMRKEFREGVPPLLLLDEDGHVRTALGVPKDETWILAFAAGGQQRLVEKGAPSAAAAKRLWAAVQR